MDEYAVGSLDHNVPFLLTLGTSTTPTYGSDLSPALKDQAILIRSELPALDTDQAHALLRYIQSRDASQLPCNSRDAPTKHRFKVKTAERSILLPPRRARLPDGIEAPSPTAVLHSPYSPLSPISPLYADGIMDAQWIRKHQDLIPSVILCFYTLTADPTLATLYDNKIKTDVNNVRGLLSQSGYKSKLAVVFLSDQATRSLENLQERLENLRRGCGVDPKLLFFVSPNDSQDELERMGENMLTTLYSVSMEYYRDLGRHCRKKRGRGIAPQPTVPPTFGTSQTLSLAGWNVRYDFKSAIFAEFRAEMDVALRSYEQAYENLLSSELMEVIPSWSPRWNEARFLADVIAVRCLRCMLWNGQHSAAARRWQLHRERIADFLDRRLRGTRNYGWEAWEARWAIVMANLIERAQIPDFVPDTLKVYLQPEKSAMGERLQPWELLHHPGYWYRLAAKHTQSRRLYAQKIPDDDRRSPGLSPASHVAKSAFSYDTYMCPDPYEEFPLNHAGVDHARMIIDRLMRAREEFLSRKQFRFAAEISLECARELASVKEWEKMMEILLPLWKDLPFRTEGWIAIADELNWSLRTAAVAVGNAELVLALDWELLSRNFPKCVGWHYDITKSLEGITCEAKPSVSIPDGRVLPFVSSTFLFKDEQGKAGQSVKSQLFIKSNAHQGSAPVVLSSIIINFTGCLNQVILQHKDMDILEQKNDSVSVSTVELIRDADTPEQLGSDISNSNVTLNGKANLTLSPGQTLVFNLDIPLREPGETRANSLVLNLESEAFDLRQTLKFPERNAHYFWYISASVSKRVTRPSPLVIKVLPRPPKLEVKCPAWMEQYYTDEAIDLRFQLINGEDVEAVAKLDVTLFGESPPTFTVDVPGNDGEKTSSNIRSEESSLLAAPLGSIPSSESSLIRLRLPPIDRPSQYDLTIKVTYFLSTNPGTPITQTAVFQLNILSPFEANHDLLPRVHPEPWPSFFDTDGIPNPDPDYSSSGVPIPFKGLSQFWSLQTRYASFATEPLRIHDLDVQLSSPPTVRCSATKTFTLPPNDDEASIIPPQQIQHASFNLTAQKISLDDRTPTPMDVVFVIKWSRSSSSSLSSSSDAAATTTTTTAAAAAGTAVINTTSIPIPRFNLFGTEPRVLATVAAAAENSDYVKLAIHIENASNHFLTFGITMEPSDQFAFSGPKSTSLSLLPVQRRKVEWRLVPFDDRTEGEGEKKKKQNGSWIELKGLVVRDKYYQKVLRVVPAGEGVRLNKEGGGVEVWVPGR